MNNTLNLSLIEGRLTADPDFLNVKGGYPLCKFDIAVSYKTGEKEEVSFISVNTWNKIAEACSQFLKKGTLVRVKGRLKQDIWKDKNGTPKYKVFIEAHSVEFLGRNKNAKSMLPM